MKIATDLEQSRKLSEFLSAESSDMHYVFMGIGGAAFQDIFDKTATLLPGNKNNKYPYEPAWSLSALLELIRNHDRHELYLYEGGYYFECGEFMTESYFNPIDSAFEMVCWLKENGYI